MSRQRKDKSELASFNDDVVFDTFDRLRVEIDGKVILNTKAQLTLEVTKQWLIDKFNKFKFNNVCEFEFKGFKVKLSVVGVYKTLRNE